jgi:hypothetical protein
LGDPHRASASPTALIAYLVMPLGKVAAGLVVAVGVAISLYISFDTNDTTGYVASGAFTGPALCSRSDIAYEQTGRPYAVRLPDLAGLVLKGDGSPCLDLAPWVETHLNAWHLFLNGIFWTFLVYGIVLIPVHVIKRSAASLRERQ